MEWLQLDPWNRTTGTTFTGSSSDLADHLLLPLAGTNATVTHQVEQLLLSRVDSYVVDRVRTSVVLLTTPWGKHRWIPRPKPRP